MDNEGGEKMKFIIKDWADNLIFDEKFSSFEDAEYFLDCFFISRNMDYEEWRGEYYIIERD